MKDRTPQTVNDRSPGRNLTGGLPEDEGVKCQQLGIPFTQPLPLTPAWWGGPPGPRGRPRPAARRGGTGLHTGEGARRTRLRWRHLAESKGYPLSAKWPGLDDRHGQSAGNSGTHYLAQPRTAPLHDVLRGSG